MSVFKRILVPLDGSPVDEAILGYVEEIGRMCGSEVVLLRVAHYHTRDTMTHEVEDAAKQLAEAAARLEGKGLPVRTVLGRGEPAEVVVEQAEALGADLIAMATHGHGRLPRLVYGSVADQVRHRSSVPLLLVKPPGGEARKAGH